MNFPYDLWPIWCDYLEEQGQNTELLRYVMIWGINNCYALNAVILDEWIFLYGYGDIVYRSYDNDNYNTGDAGLLYLNSCNYYHNMKGDMHGESLDDCPYMYGSGIDDYFEYSWE